MILLLKSKIPVDAGRKVVKKVEYCQLKFDQCH